jgi:ArsR family transcriptional regulator, arsenate/arsenite/antimonite-responsive transcriptional repressor
MIDAIDPVTLFKALADDTRLKILRLLAGQELCACSILEEFRFTQPTLSYHMKLLVGSGLVRASRDGAWVRYSLDKEHFNELSGYLAGFCDEPAPGSESEILSVGASRRGA